MSWVAGVGGTVCHMDLGCDTDTTCVRLWLCTARFLGRKRSSLQNEEQKSQSQLPAYALVGVAVCRRAQWPVMCYV